MSSLTTSNRASGVFLHLTSLPGPFGIGDLGQAALQWIDTLAQTGQRWWQILPVGPTGFGDSPYQSPSTFAGNTNLLDPESLQQDGLITATELAASEFPAGAINYPAVIRAKQLLLAAAFARFQAGDSPALRAPFQQFRERESAWLDDFAIFAAIKEHFGGLPWWSWPRELALREPNALQQIAETHATAIEMQRFGQFLFFRQWQRLRDHATQRGVQFLGDVPIYVAEDSADVWAHPELFLLDANRRPLFVGGVPPDYFSSTGQLWGNPVYDWDAHRRTGFRWWIERMKGARKLFDLVRIDHFRGIEGYWSVPAGSPTAESGSWVPGPRDELLAAIRDALGELPVVAEDLGVITPEVDTLRERFQLPGMRVLQFAFGGAVESRFLPHRFTRDLLVTTGTHDNDTTRGWFDKLTVAERHAFESYLPGASAEPVWSLIRLAWSSVADYAITPLSDLLDLGSEARLNTPGIASGNWGWRASEADMNNPAWIERLTEYTRVYERGASPDSRT